MECDQRPADFITNCQAFFVFFCQGYLELRGDQPDEKRPNNEALQSLPTFLIVNDIILLGSTRNFEAQTSSLSGQTNLFSCIIFKLPMIRLTRAPTVRGAVRSLLFFRNASSNQQPAQAMTAEKVGLPMRFYIPPSFKNYPNVFLHPIHCFKLLLRRLYNFGRMTAGIAIFRMRGSFKPKFLLWKNEAVDVYVKVNKAFAQRKLKNSDALLSMWSRGPLLKRQNMLPKTHHYSWKLKRLLSPPKLEVFAPFSSPDEPMSLVILVYRFRTEEELISVEDRTGSKSATTTTVDAHLGFALDIRTDEMRLIGSTFESGINDLVDTSQNQLKMGTMMLVHGDIFRKDDKGLEKLLLDK